MKNSNSHEIIEDPVDLQKHLALIRYIPENGIMFMQMMFSKENPDVVSILKEPNLLRMACAYASGMPNPENLPMFHFAKMKYPKMFDILGGVRMMAMEDGLTTLSTMISNQKSDTRNSWEMLKKKAKTSHGNKWEMPNEGNGKPVVNTSMPS